MSEPHLSSLRARRTYSLQDFSPGEEWNHLSAIRARQIRSGADITYTRLLLPEICANLLQTEHVLDIGCGVGVGTAAFNDMTGSAVGIDPSGDSIAEARKAFPEVEFYHSSAETFSSEPLFDVAVSNMVLMNVPDVEHHLRSIGNLLQNSRRIIISLAHPTYWPLYKGLCHNSFRHLETARYTIPFTISSDRSNVTTSTYIHRPIRDYAEILRRTGVKVERITEPVPDRKLADLYPEPWLYPRYLFIFGHFL